MLLNTKEFIMMKTAKEALKYWEQLKEQEKRFPQAHIYTNIKNQGVDMQELAKTNPYLFEMFTRIFSGVETPETVQTWNYYKQAYEELEAQGLMKFKNLRDKVMNEKMNSFVKKVDGPCLIPLSELEEVVTEKKRKGEVSIQLEFNDYMDLIEKYYGFDHRDFFQKHGKEKVDYATMLGLTKKEYKEYSNVSPSKNLIAAKMCVLHDKYEEVNGMPYVDFWHHLMDHDFAEVSNGSVMTLWADYEPEDFEDEEIEVPAVLFEKFRKVLFKEVTQYPYYQGEEPEEIEFHIWW